ncbi:MAG: MBL fold metallo-hydrolase [Myxococcales bacterium]|jgi:beta-lactamase superfamily II metal-dependent hydrolase|nr:MBL fold metallo-hydrolase [Myxococcales bacterium]
MKMPLFPKLLLALFALFLGLPLALADEAAPLRFHVLDVGQGDALFISSPAGKNVLIDAGTPESTKSLLARLDELVQGPLDLVVMTHPHADHIGGMAEILRKKGAKLFLDPGFDHASKMYADLVVTLEELAIPVRLGQTGRKIDLGGGAELEVLAPKLPFHKNTRSDANANTIVARLTYGATSFYLSGDSEAETEEEVLKEIVKAQGRSIRSNVYKIAHHGSRHASGDAILAELKPDFAVVSAGKNNRYGHPTQEALDRCRKAGAQVYRTDTDGEVIFTSDGKHVRVQTQHSGDPTFDRSTPSAPALTAAAATDVSAEGYLASRKGRTFHHVSCPNAAKIASGNRVRLATLQEARATDKAPAKCCLNDRGLPKHAGSAPAKDLAKAKPGVASDAGAAVQFASGSDPDSSHSAARDHAANITEDGYRSSKNSKKFHKANCGGAARIKASNLLTFPTREAALASGREPAADCKP